MTHQEVIKRIVLEIQHSEIRILINPVPLHLRDVVVGEIKLFERVAMMERRYVAEDVVQAGAQYQPVVGELGDAEVGERPERIHVDDGQVVVLHVECAQRSQAH